MSKEPTSSSNWREAQEEKIKKRLNVEDKGVLVGDMLTSLGLLPHLQDDDLYEWHTNRVSYISEILGVVQDEGIDTNSGEF